MNPLPAYQNLKVKTFTFGCKVNRADTAAIESRFVQGDAELIDEGVPDLVIVNTCTVTSSADRQAKKLIRKLHREHPDTKIVVTGCSVESDAEAFKKIDGVHEAISIRDQNKIPEMFGFEMDQNEPEPFAIPGKTRAILKMQDGCNAYCSFCILPFIRGRSASIPLDQLIREAKGYERLGFKEIVVTGTHIGAYGRDLKPRIRLSDALREIISAVPTLYIRVSSAEPSTLTSDFISLVQEREQIRPHFHIPLQSGSDAVLRRMNRKYTLKSFAQKVEALSKVRSRVAIGTDVIVGFPGETDEDFEKTLQYLKESPISFFHVFRFSPRPGTKANDLKDTVSDRTKYERMRILFELGERKRLAFYKNWLGEREKVLVEQKRDEKGRLTGHTAHYLPVHFEGPDRLKKREIDVKIRSVAEGVVVGEVI